MQDCARKINLEVLVLAKSVDQTTSSAALEDHMLYAYTFFHTTSMDLKQGLAQWTENNSTASSVFFSVQCITSSDVNRLHPTCLRTASPQRTRPPLDPGRPRTWIQHQQGHHATHASRVQEHPACARVARCLPRLLPEAVLIYKVLARSPHSICHAGCKVCIKEHPQHAMPPRSTGHLLPRGDRQTTSTTGGARPGLTEQTDLPCKLFDWGRLRTVLIGDACYMPPYLVFRC
eukprot:1158004-Pelagomonas_calceolata.AAC.2